MSFRRFCIIMSTALCLGVAGLGTATGLTPAWAQQSESASSDSPASTSEGIRGVAAGLQSPSANANPAALPVSSGLPLWVGALLLMLGAFLAVLGGIGACLYLQRHAEWQKRRTIGHVLATELETRLLAYEAVPLPTSAEAGVSFVSAITALSAIDSGFYTTQALMYLLPDKLAAHISVHYAAVQRVSDFVKGQSIAAAARMLQGNRLGGHPCPDAGTMREAHAELGAAFRGLDKVIIALRAVG